MTATPTLSLTRDILSRPGLEKSCHGIEADPKPRFFALRFDSFTVNIESTANKVMDSIARFAIDDQKKIIMALLETLDEPGTSLILKEDKLLGQETAYVTRRADSPGGFSNLLFSR